MSAMRQQDWVVISKYAFILLLGVAFTSRGEALYEAPRWREEIANGYFSYHRLAAIDFPVNDHIEPEYGMYTSCFFITGMNIVRLCGMATWSTE